LKLCLTFILKSFKAVDQAVKICLLRTTNFFHAIRLLEKEYISIYKLINGFKGILESIEETSVKVEADLARLEKAYEEKARLIASIHEEKALVDDESDISKTFKEF